VIQSGKKLYAFVTADYWIDLGRPEHYQDAHRHIFDGAVPLALPFAEGKIFGSGAVQPAGTLQAPVFIGAGVTVEPGAHVGPYVVLGDGCHIARGARVVDSILWDKVTVGPDASIERSIVASRVRVGAGAQLAPASVIGHDVVIDPGTQVPEGSRVVAEGVPTA
ncbi:MAG: NDP-sugar synthase, partial [Candidatus Eremiobacteraeota bacterium]|nr:NDP-sugar synthase [Candidatus Eremiobacteraeota bacterium]